MPGVLLALVAKMAGLGTAAKGAAVAATTALAMAVAGGAAGVLPLPGDGAEVALLQSAVQGRSATEATTTSAPPTTVGRTVVQTARSASATSSAGPVSARAGGTVAADATTSTSLPRVADATLSSLPALPALPACVADLIPAAGARPDPATLIVRLPACVRSVLAAHLPLDTIQRLIGSANLPVDLVRCLSSVLRTVTAAAGANLSGLPQLLSACLPGGVIPGAGSGRTTGSVPIPDFGFGFGR